MELDETKSLANPRRLSFREEAIKESFQVVMILMAALILGTYIWPPQKRASTRPEPSSRPPPAANREPPIHIPVPGGIVYFGRGLARGAKIPVAATRQDFDRMHQLLTAKDAVGLGELEGQGRIWLEPFNARARAIQSGGFFSGVYEVRIEVGARHGRAAWVDVERLSPTRL